MGDRPSVRNPQYIAYLGMANQSYSVGNPRCINEERLAAPFDYHDLTAAPGVGSIGRIEFIQQAN